MKAIYFLSMTISFRKFIIFVVKDAPFSISMHLFHLFLGQVAKERILWLPDPEKNIQIPLAAYS